MFGNAIHVCSLDVHYDGGVCLVPAVKETARVVLMPASDGTVTSPSQKGRLCQKERLEVELKSIDLVGFARWDSTCDHSPAWRAAIRSFGIMLANRPTWSDPHISRERAIALVFDAL